MKKIIQIFIFFACCDISISASSITDPVADFFSFNVSNLKTVYVLQGRMGSSTNNTVMIGYISNDIDADPSAPMWDVYSPQPDGSYNIVGKNTTNGADLGFNADFNKNEYNIGFIPEVNSYGLLYTTYDEKSAPYEICQLHAIVVNSNSWSDVLVGSPINEITPQDETSLSNVISQRFSNPPSPAIQVLTPATFPTASPGATSSVTIASLSATPNPIPAGPSVLSISAAITGLGSNLPQVIWCESNDTNRNWSAPIPMTAGDANQWAASLTQSGAQYSGLTFYYQIIAQDSAGIYATASDSLPMTYTGSGLGASALPNWAWIVTGILLIVVVAKFLPKKNEKQ